MAPERWLPPGYMVGSAGVAEDVRGRKDDTLCALCNASVGTLAGTGPASVARFEKSDNKFGPP